MTFPSVSVLTGDETFVCTQDGDTKITALWQINDYVQNYNDPIIAFDTLADLKAFVPNSVGSIVYLKGRYTAGDGCEGLFVLTDTNPGQDNDGTIFQLDMATVWAIRQFRGPLSIRWFGAKQDGVSNDTNPIRKTVAACSAIGGGTVYFPSSPNASKLTDTIFFGSNIKFLGDSPEQSKIRVNVSGWQGGYMEPLFRNINYSASVITDQNITFENLFIDGSRLSPMDGGAHAIRTRMAEDVLVQNVRFKDVENGTAFLNTKNTRTLFCDYSATVGYTGNCAFDHWDGAGVVKVIGCNVNGKVGQALQFTGVGTWGESGESYDCLFMGNSVKGASTSGGGSSSYIVNANHSNSKVGKVRIIGNHAEDGDIAYAITGEGALFCVDANTALRCRNTAFYATNDGGGAFPNYINLTNHTAVSCGSWTGSIVQFKGGTGHNLSNVTVKGGSCLHAIDMSGAVDWKASNNNLDGWSVTPYKVGTSGAYSIDNVSNGTWTPSLAFGTSATGMTYEKQEGIWTKSGQNVSFKGFFKLTNKGDSTGPATVEGIPFVAQSYGGTTTYQTCGTVPAFSYLTNINPYPPGLRISNQSIQIFGYGAGSSSQLNQSQFTSTSQMWIEGSFICSPEV